MRAFPLAAAVASLVVLPPPAAATFPGGNGKIAFTSNRDGISQIYVMDPSGANQTRLTTPGNASQPAWSPDGKRLAYVTGGVIHTMHADGGDDQTVVNGSQPAWSGDGEKLVFLCGGALCAVAAQGGPVTPLNISGDQPSWSPDGTQIAFESDGAIHTVGANGQGSLQWTFPTNDAIDENPDWAPDGTSITFHRSADTQANMVDADIFRVTGSGGPPAALTTATGDDLDAVTSPDGASLAWMRLDGFAVQIMVDGAFVTSAGYNTQPSWQATPDRDGDALLDVWETDGYDEDGDGTIDVDLPAMGADPDRKDVFVELDHMTGRRLDRIAVQAVVDAFGHAPVANLNGVSGIALHVDNGADSEMDPLTHGTWGARSRQDVIAANTDLASLSGETFDWVQRFDPIKAGNFDPARTPIFHYAISALDKPDSTGGRARGESVASIAGSDFVLTLDPTAFNLSPEALRIAAGTLMHELGHNLALRHGGGDDVGRKPNYLSVMNYVFQGSWLRRDASFILDYSTSSFSLDEGSLDESGGFGLASGPAGFWTEYGCGSEKRQVVIGVTDVDWNCDNLISTTSLSADINADDAVNPLAGHLDWPALRFDGGEVGAGARFQLATGPAGEEPPFTEVLAAARRITNATPPTATPTPTPSPTPPAATKRPAVTALSLRPRRFRAARGRGASIGLPRHARVSYTLTEPSRTRFTVVRLRSGREVAKVGRFRHTGLAGRNRFTFTGRIGRRPLKAGRYRLTASAPGGAQRVRFTIVRRRVG